VAARQELGERAAGGDRILRVTDDGPVSLRDARDLAAQPRVLVELVEELAGMPVDVDLVGRHERAERGRVPGDVLDRRTEGVRWRAERDVVALDRRVDAENLGPTREELEDARAGGGDADEKHPLAHRQAKNLPGLPTTRARTDSSSRPAARSRGRKLSRMYR
jgi:hypothetical protein